MHSLVMPESLTGLDINRDETLGEQVIALALASIPVVCWCADRQIDDTELIVGAHDGPDVGITSIGIGIVFPGLVTEFTGFGNGMKSPLQRAGLGVEGAHVARRHLDTAGTVVDDGANDDLVMTHQWW